MLFNTDQVIEIANAGGGLILKSNDFTLTDLIKIANACNGKGKITIKNSDYFNCDDLIKLSNASKGNIIFDLTK